MDARLSNLVKGVKNRDSGHGTSNAGSGQGADGPTTDMDFNPQDFQNNRRQHLHYEARSYQGSRATKLEKEVRHEDKREMES